MALASSTMLESDILSRMYAYQALYYLFNDEDQVRTSVLRDFDSSQQDTIYGHWKYGMNTVDSLLIWVIACDGKTEEKSAAKEFLLEYFEEQGMTQDKLDQIVNTGSMLSMIIAPIRYSILHDPAFGWCPTNPDNSLAC